MIVIVEDNQTMRLGMQESLSREGHDVQAFADAPQALEFLQHNAVDCLITDLRMEPMDGLELLKKIKQSYPQIEVILVSAYGSVKDAVQAMRDGAADYLTKPFSPDELRVRVDKVLAKLAQEQKINRLMEQNRLLEDDLSSEFSTMVGNSSVMKSILELIERVAREDSSVLVSGESGTGKELVARAIHRHSKRNENPFIRVNCAALNDNLLESELFGHEKGAFTGAVRQKKGRFELADEGTLFLDEIGDISAAMQVKLLRVLQEKEFERVGGEQTIKTDVRIITATNKQLGKLIQQQKFREDLYYRLNVIPVELPALRERQQDITLLVKHFLDKLQSSKTINNAGMELLKNYAWPGNIRELENLIERLHVISPVDEIPAELITRFLTSTNGVSSSHKKLPLDDALFNFEKNLIQDAMQQTKGVKNRAAKLLGINTSALYYKLEKFGLI